MMDTFKCLQINLHHAKDPTRVLENEFSKGGFKVGLLQEPFTGSTSKIEALKCGTIVYDGSGTSSPRAALLFNGIKYIPLGQFINKDFVAAYTEMTINGCLKKIAFASGYHDATKNVVPEYLEKFIAFCKDNGIEFIYGCDANAHNKVWASKRTDTRGIEFLEFITLNDLYILNKGEQPTYLTTKETRNGTILAQDVIDLTLCSGTITAKIKEWLVSTVPPCSDHSLIDIHLDCANDNHDTKFRNPKKTNWKRFETILASKLTSLDLGIKTTNQLDFQVNKFTRLVLSKAHTQLATKKLPGKTIQVTPGGLTI